MALALLFRRGSILFISLEVQKLGSKSGLFLLVAFRPKESWSWQLFEPKVSWSYGLFQPNLGLLQLSDPAGPLWINLLLILSGYEWSASPYSTAQLPHEPSWGHGLEDPRPRAPWSTRKTTAGSSLARATRSKSFSRTTFKQLTRAVKAHQSYNKKLLTPEICRK